MAEDPNHPVSDLRVAHRWALLVFGRLPPWARIRIVRVLAPTHTVGALCLIDHDGSLLMLRQRHRRGWTLPGGLINRGETADQAVCREVREETGLDVEVGLPFATIVEPRSRRVDILYHVPVEEPLKVAARSEAVGARWLRPEDAGTVDEPTRTVLDAFARRNQPDVHSGRLLGRWPPPAPAPAPTPTPED